MYKTVKLLDNKYCLDGGIGRHWGFKFPWLWPYGFDPRSRYQLCAHSSVGKSIGFLIRWSGVRVPLGVPT